MYNISTADLCDENQDKEIQVLPSNFKNFGALKRFYGQIETVKLDKSNWRLLEMLRDRNGEGKILVVDNAKEYFGVVGDKLMAFALSNNWQAIILNGYVRDTDETKNINVGLFAIGRCPLRNFEKNESSHGCELHFDGLSFNQGDYLYADNDGVIISKEKLL
ncbi:ribonuclease E activity regulator RraA [Arcobacteraceae bacterium]|jgi:regulator of ribonuclease activity A|nr:ribonuclease E activity regulator RraA [Arcobacteraceae bacterium]